MIEIFWDWDQTMVPNNDGQWWLNALQNIGKEINHSVDLALDVLEVCLYKVN